MQGNTNLSDYELLLTKLRDFKRKYYRNEIIKGGLYFLAFLLVSYIVVALVEYYGHFSTTARTIMFFTFVGVNAAILGKFVVVPVLKLFELSQTLSYTQAAEIIGQHFTEVKDKLLNTLQLHEQAQQIDPAQRALITASIDQKVRLIKPVPFVNAVDYNKNRKYLKYAAIPLAVILIILALAPKMLLESSERLVSYNRYYEIEAPFDFLLQNKDLKGLKGENYTIDLKIKGEELPAEVFLMINGNPYKMSSASKTDFNYTLKNLQKDVELQFTANGFSSRPYELTVLPKPFLQKFELQLDYPSYIGKKDETVQNIGDLTIPAGTKVNWGFFTENTDKVTLSFDGKLLPAERRDENFFGFERKFMNDEIYNIKTSNKYVPESDSIQYRINVIPDAYPGIRVEQEQDSGRLKNIYFSGEVTDDYGFKGLTFNYRYIKSQDSAKLKTAKRENIGIASNRLMQRFYHYFDLSTVDVQPGDEVEYFFEVWDNDGVNGSKSSRSQKFFFKAPSLDEIEKQTESNNKELENQMESAMRQARQLQKEMEDARMKMINSKNFDWQDKKSVNEILEKQKKLENSLQELQKKFDQNLQQQNEFKQMDEQLLEKHQKLQELFEEVLDEKTKKLFEELQKLMEQNAKDQLQNKLDEMKFNDKEVEKELDRMMELFKQLQFEQKLQETIEKLDKLAEKQEQLSKETEEKKGGDNEELKKKQDELNKEFDELRKDMEELEKKNEELDNENPMEDTEKQEEDIEQEMNESKENLDQKKNNKASQNQKSAAEKMKEMSKKLQEMQQQMGQEGQMEDYQTLRQILENLVYVSIEQEKMMDELKATNQYNPQYIELAQRQRKLKDDAKIIEDSLFALSKRVVQLKSFINKEIGEINFNMDKSLEAFGERNTPRVLTHGQYAMTSLNNLALMLSEVMQQMQQAMAQQKNCKGGNCDDPKPGQKSGKKSMSDMRKLQEQLGKQIEEMKKGMQGQGGRQGMSEELAKMAAQQEMLRRQLQQMKEQMQKENGGLPSNELNQIQQMMDKNEEDLVNKRITDETLKRQKEIMVRMLEAEKAEKKQEFDDKRESKTADQRNNATPPMLEKYLKMKEKEAEMLRTVPPSLNPYYKEKVKEYFQGTTAR